MFDRLIILLAFALLLATAYLLWRIRLQQQTQRLAVADPGGPAELASLPLTGGPAVLYFTTPTCAQCRYQQTPALAQVQEHVAGLQVFKLDAVEHQRLADYYHVMTVPTTVVLDSQRRPVAINHGLATSERLLAQVGQANVTRNPRLLRQRASSGLRIARYASTHKLRIKEENYHAPHLQQHHRVGWQHAAGAAQSDGPTSGRRR